MLSILFPVYTFIVRLSQYMLVVPILFALFLAYFYFHGYSHIFCITVHFYFINVHKPF